MLTWVDWFCRHAAEGLSPEIRTGDPRQDMAIWLFDWLRAVRDGRAQHENLLDETWHVLLVPFAAPFTPPGTSALLAQGGTFAQPLGLVLTRDTAALLSDARFPASVDGTWRDALAENQAVYIDIPHGAVLLELTPGDVVELRAILAANYLPSPEGMHGETLTFVALLTSRGSERGRGRFIGVLAPGGRTLAMASTQRPALTQADFTLKAPFVDREAEAREPILATPRERLVQGKPRRDESLFAMTRLRPAHDRLGRPPSQIDARWNLTSRQDVAGHFKLQPYGPGGTLRKLIWVEAYGRGPEDAQAKPRAVRI